MRCELVPGLSCTWHIVIGSLLLALLVAEIACRRRYSMGLCAVLGCWRFCGYSFSIWMARGDPDLRLARDAGFELQKHRFWHRPIFG